MNKYRILFLFLVFATCALCSCNKEPKIEHEHTYASTYSFNEEFHYYQATCDHKTLVKEIEPHVFLEWTTILEPSEETFGMKKRVCSLCGYQDIKEIEKLPHTHKYSNAYSYDESYHWYQATCEHRDEIIDIEEHVFEGRICTICNYEKEYGKGLITCDISSTTCGILSIGTCKDNELIIPEKINGKTVVSISREAFRNCTLITSITIGNSVTSIGMGAFYGCSNLTSVTIGDSVTTIESYAFSCCSGLKSVTLPQYLKTIEKSTFYGCSSLESITIKEGMESIGPSAFYDCNKLTSIHIPSSVTSIGDLAFYNCSSLRSVVLPDGITSIGKSTFESCSNLTSVTLPKNLTSIESEAFYWCNCLTSIKIPSSVTNIGQYSFRGCFNLVEVINESELDLKMGSSLYGYVACYAKQIITDEKDTKLSYIKDFVIYNGNILVSYSGSESIVTIPTYITSIGSFTFYKKMTVRSVVIPEGVTSIDYEAFYGCLNLTSITLPCSLTKIENDAFEGCYKLV